MSTTDYINKSRELSQTQDYQFLRKKGLNYIELLSNKLWTDFNAHDPGITILEVLCYAITELGYRSNFDIKDILTEESGTINNGTFFPGSEILTNAPLTPLDYRKNLIDIKGVNNAWLVYSDGTKDFQGYDNPLDNEIPIYINKKEDKLSKDSVDKYGNVLPRLKLRGLNKIIIEFGEDIEYGQLNEVEIDSAFTHTHLAKDHYVSFASKILEVDSWIDSKTQWLNSMSDPTNIDLTLPVVDGKKISVEVSEISEPANKITLIIEVTDPSEVSFAEAHFNLVENIAELVSQFNKKRKIIEETYELIHEKLYKNRNLTEDWKCIDTIDTTDIGICADIEIATNADAEEVLAKIQEAIELILNPPVRFYTLNQMLDQGMKPRQIFTGPLLEHGFLLDEEVENSQLPDCIHASDIIAAMMNLDGVEAVNNFMMTAYDENGDPIPGSASKKWCIQFNGSQKPVFQFNRSKLLLFRDGIPFIIPESGELEFSEGIYYLKTENDKLKLIGPEKDFPFPKGSHYQLDSYHSIQNDFPVVYGIGKGQLLDTETDLRRAQAKQLKAYLQHFDQILADFFKQLYHTKDLLDIESIDKTYFTHQLKEIYGIDSEFFHEEIYPESDNVLPNGIYPEDRSFYENDKTFYDRRNRFLDHLLARFSESFSEYVFMLYTVQNSAKGLSEIVIPKEELIRDKQDFLANYPEISYPRGLGLNYLQEISSNPDHLAKIGLRGGFEKRIAALLGINYLELRNIVDVEAKETWSYRINGQTYSFELLHAGGMGLEDRWVSAQELMKDINSYQVVIYSNSYIRLMDEDDLDIVKYERIFNTPEEAEEFIPELHRVLNSVMENFYCIEHILLRPMLTENLNDEDLLTVCLNDDCYSEANNDPYSFKATLVFPGWFGRFRNRYFRRYAETLIRSEAPAHTLIKICWVGREDLITFQKAYSDWIKAYRSLRNRYCLQTLSDRAKKDYTNRLSSLVEKLNLLNTIFDEGTLHDCLESEFDNPISLNNSSLGTLKRIEP
jgi:hypothetical protein